MTKYRVKWKDFQPYIDHGEIIDIGKKNIKKIKWSSEQKLRPLSSGYDSIKEAIEEDIYDTSLIFGKYYFLSDNKDKSAWNIARCIIRVIRLYRKLEKHHLI